MTPPPGERSIGAVVCDRGGTLTPWRQADLGEQWRVFAREVHGVPLDSPDVARADLDAARDLAERIGVSPVRAGYVGDRMYEDVRGPQQVGLRAIWIPHSSGRANPQVAVAATPDAVARTPLDPLDIVDRWLRDG